VRKTLWNGLFVFLLLAALLAGLGRTLLRPKLINYYENRYAYRVARPTAAALLDGGFQDALEDALSDQIPGAQTMKKDYHLAFSTYQRLTALPLSHAEPETLFHIGPVLLRDGYLLHRYRPLDPERDALDRRIENYRAAFAAHPDTAFYVYFIEEAADLDLTTGEKNGVADRLEAGLGLPEGRFGRFSIDSFADVQRDFYRTDHHWQYTGSYRGYTELLGMLLPGETPLAPAETVRVGVSRGSKASGRALAAFSEEFWAYRFDFPAQEATLGGAPLRDYGSQDLFLGGLAPDTLRYGSFYGDDLGELTLRCPENAGRGELLIVGDSFDNAVLKLLASHFEATYSVDLRYYAVVTGRPFSLGDFLAEHPDAKVLLAGSLSYFLLDTFDLED